MTECIDATGLAALEVAIAEVEAADRHLSSVTDRARAELNESIAALTRVATAMWTDLESSADFRAIAARRLYWGLPSLPPDNIAVALGYRSKREMTAAAGEVETDVACADCGAGIKAASRTELKEVTAAGSRSPQRRSWGADEPLRCRPCKQVHRQRQQEEERQRWMALEDEDDTIVDWPWEL